jgi:sialic acid synthase SpsE
MEVQAYKKRALLFCVPEYPPRQIRIPRHFRTMFDGFSSHYQNWLVPATFAALGAGVIECHVLSAELHPTTFLPDRSVSLTFQQFARMVYAVTKVKPLALEGGP